MDPGNADKSSPVIKQADSTKTFPSSTNIRITISDEDLFEMLSIMTSGITGRVICQSLMKHCER